jgi:hypothetical protein
VPVSVTIIAMAIANKKKKLNLSFAKYIKDEEKECKHAFDLKLKLPLLVVGSQYNQFSKKFKVIKLQHQTGGIMCHQHLMYAIVLPQSDFFKENIKLLQERFGENSFGIFSHSLADYNKYNNFLKGKLQLSGCDDNFFYVEEAIYPVTFDYHNITKLSSIKLPFDVKDDTSLFDYFSGSNKRLPIPHFNLFILTENSD